jgi:signal transduction histidine kinase
VQDGELCFSVTDSGPGFAVDGAHAGSGLQGMADRLAALGGLLEVQSAPGQGTTVAGRLHVTSP